MIFSKNLKRMKLFVKKEQFSRAPKGQSRAADVGPQVPAPLPFPSVLSRAWPRRKLTPGPAGEGDSASAPRGVSLISLVIVENIHFANPSAKNIYILYITLPSAFLAELGGSIFAISLESVKHTQQISFREY